LTVADNIAIGNGYPTTLGRVNRRALRRRTVELLDRYAIAARPDDLVGDLRPSDQTMVAIARALQDEDEQEQLVNVLVLDEPTASLPAQEVDMLLAALRQCAGIGQTILYVSHRIDEIREITDAVTVLRDGELIVTRSSTGMSEADLIEHIVGRPLDRVFATPATPPASDVVLDVKGLRGGPLSDVSFEVQRGEIVGVAGLLGSGRTELLQMIFGSYPRLGGEVRLHGQPFSPRRPKDAMDRAVALVPEDREHDAAFLDLSVRENLLAASITESWRGWRLSRRSEREDARSAIATFGIRTDGETALFSSLSGGNQQKVVLARWLRRAPSLVLLDDPTQGVDVGARAELYQWISRSAESGMAAVLVSSDFEELAQVASRVLVLRDGRITASLTGDDVERQRITELVYASEDDAA
jgi:ribose transport system ATP-binding protein